MSENNLSDIISSLAANKEFSSIVERVRESGDISSIFGEVASLLGTDGENGGAKSENVTQVKDSVQETSVADTDENAQETGGESKDTDNEVQAAGLLLGKESEGDGGGGGFDTGSLLGGLLPLFARSITENSALLLALKPYLNKKRCELIDSIIKISKLAGIVSLAK